MSLLLRDDTLSLSIAGFAEYARKRGMLVSSAEVIDCMNACVALAPRNMTDLQSTLAPCFAKSPEDLDIFAVVFHAYFYNENTAPLTAVLNTELQLRFGAGEGKAKRADATNEHADQQDQDIKRQSSDGWQSHMISERGIPEPLKLFLQQDKPGAAAKLMNHPLTEIGKKSIAAAFAKIADKISPKEIAQIQRTLQEYAQLSNEVQKLRSGSSSSSQKKLHARHSDHHTWSMPAWFGADTAPPALLAAQLDNLDKNQLAIIIQAAQQAAAAIKPFFSRNPGTGRRRLALDYRGTMHASMTTFGEPFKLIYNARRRRLRRLVTFCDVSGSVKKATGILLSFLFGLHQAFEGRARHFLFVSQIDEVTPFFSLPSYEECYGRITGASGVDFRGYSNYGKALSLLWENYRSAFDYETVVLFLGDARTNQFDPRPDIIRTIQGTVRAAFFLNPEDPGEWGTGDSSVNIYKENTQIIDISTFGNLLRFLNRLPGMLLSR